MKRTIIAAIAMLLVGAPAALAAGRDGPRIMMLLDEDGDGAISKAEIEALRQRLFEAADLNRDGVVDKAELEDARARLQEHADAARARFGMMFRRMDGDGDGRVTRQEAAAQPGFFDLLDRDGDGRLTEGELTALARLRPTRLP